jgi:putative transposase
MISFKGVHFPKEVILYAVFFYVRYGVSYRDLEEIMEERGVQVDHATLNRWVFVYSPLIAAEAKKLKRTAASSWRMDESVLQLSCIKDEGRPLGIALQEEISNHHKLH